MGTSEARSARRRRHALAALAPYFGASADAILALPMPTIPGAISAVELPPRYLRVALPDWASHAGVDGHLLVPHAVLTDGENFSWQCVDWLSAAFFMLEGLAEREFERRHGPIHSNAFRLAEWNPLAWQHAWVNRIAMFLRSWAAREAEESEETLFGAMPSARLLLTHDVDAVRKTIAIRFKQGAFNLVNAMRLLARGRLAEAVRRTRVSLRFLFRTDRYDWLEEVCRMEQAVGLTGVFHFFAGRPEFNLTTWLIDPGYDVLAPAMVKRVQAVREQGGVIGLHPSFSSWSDPERIGRERDRLVQAAGIPAIEHCRQHWLRFSWDRTWEAQSRAGLRLDTTCGFNDRPGFRTSAALCWSPWSEAREEPYAIRAMPMVLMDSQLYDYGLLDGEIASESMRHWVNEVIAVGGTASFLWHPHTLGDDFGWRKGFEQLLALVRR